MVPFHGVYRNPIVVETALSMPWFWMRNSSIPRCHLAPASDPAEACLGDGNNSCGLVDLANPRDARGGSKFVGPKDAWLNTFHMTPMTPVFSDVIWHTFCYCTCSDVYPGMYSDTCFDIVYSEHVVSVRTRFWHILWHTLWHVVWHVVWHISWHILWHVVWHVV